MDGIDAVQIAMNPAGLRVLQVILAVVMFGVALDLSWADLRALLRRPLAVLVGFGAQVLLLPPLALLAAWALSAPPSIALGMILVACCPGGNVSNALTWLGKGDVATSVGLTTLSTLASPLVLPLNLALWGGMGPGTAELLTTVVLDPLELGAQVLILLAIPVVLGMSLAARAPGAAAKLRPVMRVLAIASLGLFIVAAFGANLSHFLAHIGLLFVPVALLNALALATGYGVGAALGAPESHRRALTFELGIQNSGLGLVLVFAFFDGLGGLAMICGWWGIWHILAGLAVAGWWSRRAA